MGVGIAVPLQSVEDRPDSLFLGGDRTKDCHLGISCQDRVCSFDVKHSVARGVFAGSWRALDKSPGARLDFSESGRGPGHGSNSNPSRKLSPYEVNELLAASRVESARCCYHGVDPDPWP